MLFSLQKDTLRKFDKLVAERESYFTVDVDTGGFTDQLIKFIVFYSFGTSLNCKYYYTPIQSERSSALEGNTKNTDKEYSDIFDFLGLQDYLKEISVDTAKLDSKPYTLKLDEFFFLERGLESKELIIAYLKLKLYSSIKNQKKVNIRIMLEGYSSFFGIYNKLDGWEDSGLDFRSAFLKKHSQTEQQISGQDFSNPRAIVHIRQGDTAMIKTPWNTYVNVWGDSKISMKEFDDPRKARATGHIKIEEYYEFLKLLSDHFENELTPLTVFSDGYKRAFNNCIFNQNKLGFTESQVEQLAELSEIYDRQAFRIFDNDSRFHLRIGEEDEKLYQMIQMLLHANIVVMGTQQRMVPKFLSVYCNARNMPLVIVLYNKVFPNYLGFARRELINNYLFVDINNYSIQDIADRIKKLLKKKAEESESAL